MKEAAKAMIEKLKDNGITYIGATHDINNHRSGFIMQSINYSLYYHIYIYFFMNQSSFNS